MASNDEVVMTIPVYQCPSCRQALEMNRMISKLSKNQRIALGGFDADHQNPEKNFVVVTCGNFRCDQYDKFKVIELPRVKTASARVDLTDKD